MEQVFSMTTFRTGTVGVAVNCV